MNETSNRHQIIKDALFWTQLAYGACGWLRDSEEAALRRFWIDDFLPENATDTKRGVDVEGTAWVGIGGREQWPYRFVVSVPQKMLHHDRQTFSIEQLSLDAAQQTLRIEIIYEKQVA